MRVGPVAARLLGATLIVVSLVLLKDSVSTSFDCQPGSLAEEIPCVADDGYNFTAGELVFEPYEGFCEDFRCAPEFATASGYVVQCGDGLFSRDGGLHRACAAHGGVARALFER